MVKKIKIIVDDNVRDPEVIIRHLPYVMSGTLRGRIRSGSLRTFRVLSRYSQNFQRAENNWGLKLQDPEVTDRKRLDRVLCGFFLNDMESLRAPAKLLKPNQPDNLECAGKGFRS